MTRRDAHRFLIAYDITDDRRRDRVARCLQRHGDRVQFSVFIVDVNPARILRLRRELSAIIVVDADSVLICDLGLTNSSHGQNLSFIGRTRPITGDGSRVL